MLHPNIRRQNNKGCESLATNAITTYKTKHINIRHHLVPDLVNYKVLTMVWIETSEMIGDILNKRSLSIYLRPKKHTNIILSGTYSGPAPGSI